MTDSRAVLIQHACGHHAQMLELTGPRHAAYAARHGLTFWSMKGDLHHGRPARWGKVALLRAALGMGFDLAVWLDSDTLIVRGEEDIRQALPPGPPIALCRHPGEWEGQPGHFNTGVMAVRNTPLARRFLDSVWKAGPTTHHWHEQHRLNEVIRRFPKAVQRLDDRWNCTEGVTSAPRPVVRAWHGRGPCALTQMYEAMKQLPPAAQAPPDLGFVHEDNALIKADEFIRTIPPYPEERFKGRGIVICGGGTKYFPSAWVCVRQLRRLGCKLPVQLWHLGRGEVDGAMAALLKPLGVECVDAHEVRRRHPARILNGWELKCYAMIHSPYREVLLLDADSLPVVNPEFLFRTPEFKECGGLFWPDRGRLPASARIWNLTGVAYRDEPEFETGQIAVDKCRCWRPLALTMWYNEHSDFFYRFIHGDKETFHLAWRKLGVPYAMPERPLLHIKATFCQHDFRGRRIFQHRVGDKFRLNGDNVQVPGFLFEEDCRRDLAALRKKWDGSIRS